LHEPEDPVGEEHPLHLLGHPVKPEQQVKDLGAEME
jgi:hypothetical protein